MYVDGTQHSEFEEIGSTSKTLDAALLNRHLEWLLQVGFSANMILEWAREKQMDDVDDPIPIPDPEPEPQDSQLNSFLLDDNSYDNDEGQSQSQESESQFTLSIHTSSSGKLMLLIS